MNTNDADTGADTSADSGSAGDAGVAGQRDDAVGADGATEATGARGAEHSGGEGYSGGPGDGGQGDAQSVGDDHPTEPLPWWMGRPEAQGDVTEPLPEARGDVTEPLLEVAVGGAGAVRGMPTAAAPAGNAGPAAETAAPTATGPGRAVTDSMKSGGQPRGSFVRRHALGLSLAAAALAIIAVAGGTAWGVSAAVTGSDAAAPAAMSTAVHAKKGTGAATQKHTRAAVGTVTAISGGTWTIRSAAGATVTVTVGSSTAFGTVKQPATASSFAVGDRIGVIGTRSGDTVTATRIVHLAAGKRGGGSTSPATAGPNV
ncbi:DUF5666 domain-containing protein [Leifsonia shinshuensis]